MKENTTSSKPKNLSSFIVSRVRTKQGSIFSSAASRIAIGSVALGICVMIISDGVFKGFQKNIIDRVLCFGSHIQVSAFSDSDDQQDSPISKHQAIYQSNGQNLPFPVDGVSAYIRKPGLVRSKSEMQGSLFKGVDQRFDSLRFQRVLKKGSISFLYDTAKNYGVAISQKMADKLIVDIGDNLVMYFVQKSDGSSRKPPKSRRLEIAAIYETGMEEFDDMFLFGRLDVAQRLNLWSDSLIGGMDVYLPSLDLIPVAADEISYSMGYKYKAVPITVIYEHYFAWFEVLSQNVMVVIIFIGGVVSINIMSVLVILVMEKAQMVGTLKALGARNAQVQEIFFVLGVRLCLKGVGLGAVLGVTLGLVQKKFAIIPLDQDTYYMSSVPVEFDFPQIFFYIMLISILFTLIEYIAAWIAARIRPIKSIKFS